jgi:RNA polymerase sigma factor (sigma-70 family)
VDICHGVWQDRSARLLMALEDQVTSHAGGFHTTHWSLILAAREGNSPQANAALESLCRAYWYPLYVFVRRRGFSVEDAQDLTQEFFARLLQRDFLRGVAREKGRFRSFMLASLKNFLVTDWRRGQRAKRGGGLHFVSWDELRAEERYALEPVSEVTPEDLYEQRWALAVVEQAMIRLRQEFEAAGKAGHFDTLKQWLAREATGADYEALGGQWGVSSGAVSVAVHRLRKRFAEILRTVVAHTVVGPDEVEDEVQLLAKVLV